MTKARRQAAIAELLAEQALENQTEVVNALAQQGIKATQATVSRDLEELGALKVRVPGGQSSYSIPEHPHEQLLPHEHLRRIVAEWVVEAEASANLCVLRTRVGSANVVAAAIDRSSLKQILGTVAGDDTLLVIAREGYSGAELVEMFQSFTESDGEQI